MERENQSVTNTSNQSLRKNVSKVDRALDKKSPQANKPGRKTKRSMKGKNDVPKIPTQEFQLDLEALDGYDLPVVDGKNDITSEPKTKKVKKSKPEILGVDYREREEKRLEQLLFGEILEKFEQESKSISTQPSDTPIETGKNKKASKKKVNKKTSGNSVLPEDVFGQNLGLSSLDGKKAAWVDEDDEDTKLKDVFSNRNPMDFGNSSSETGYKKFLENKFTSIHGQLNPKWAQLGQKNSKSNEDLLSDEEEDTTQDLTKTAKHLLKKSSKNLLKEIIKITRKSDINKETHSEGRYINSVQFHKSQSVALVAGSAGVVTLYQVGAQNNTKIQSINFEKFPIHKAQFSADGEEIIASSHYTGNIQVYNLTSGKNTIIPHNKQMEKGSYKNFVVSPDGKLIAYQGRFGYIHLMSARSKEWISSLKMNGEARSLTFNNDGSRLYSHGELGEVYVWDTKSRMCVHRFVDEGCISGTAVAISPTQQYLACGSSSGVVNLYNTSALENNSLPKPEKAILNLVTKISGINFHPSSEMMAIHSDAKEMAVRLVHFPSMTVFKNFPTEVKDNAHFLSIDFSPEGGYMAAGTNHGSAFLYRLNHYKQY